MSYAREPVNFLERELARVSVTVRLARLQAYQRNGDPIALSFGFERARDEAMLILDQDSNLIVEPLPPFRGSYGLQLRLAVPKA